MNKSAIVACALAAVNIFQMVAYSNQKQQVESLQRQLIAANQTNVVYNLPSSTTVMPAKPTSTPRQASVSVSTKAYVANTNTGKYHKSSCGAVKTMYDIHKVYYSTSKQAKQAGYTPCQRCNP